jgi:hypothetical protein
VSTLPAPQATTGRRWPAPPASYAWVCATWLVTRGLALLSILLTPRLLDDIDLFRGWLWYLRADVFPGYDPKWQYPPGVGPLLLAPSALHVDYAVAFALMCIAVDAAILGLLVAAHRRRPGSGWNGLWLWAVAALVVGPIMFVRFDIVPTLFAVAFVVLAARPLLAGASAAFGFVLKLWPVLLLLALPRPATRRGIVGFVVTTAALLALIAMRFVDSFSFVANQRSRGLQVESIGALPYELYSLAHGRVAYGLEYGSVQVLMRGADTVGTVVMAVGLALLVLIGWWRLRGRLEDVPTGDVALAVVLVSVATSRVYSPQFNIWIIGVCAAALLSSRTRMARVAVALVVTSIVTQVPYPWDPDGLVAGDPKVVLAQCVRIVGILLATYWAMRAIAHRPEPSGATAPVPEPQMSALSSAD